jgi:hypothetical protein
MRSSAENFEDRLLDALLERFDNLPMDYWDARVWEGLHAPEGLGG